MAAVTNTIKWLVWAPTDAALPDKTLYLAHPSSSLPSTSTGIRVAEGTWTVDAYTPPWQNYKDGIANVSIITGPNDEPISPPYVRDLFRELSVVKHLDLTDVDISNATSTYGAFYNCTDLVSLDIDTWDTSNITTMAWMFANCDSLTLLDLSSFDVSNVTTFECMFYNSPSLTYINLSTWVPSQALLSMKSMFKYCTSLTSIDVTWTGCDLSGVETVESMFHGCENLEALELTNWHIENADDFYCVFDTCKKLRTLNLSNWDFSYPLSFYSMFYDCKALQSVTFPSGAILCAAASCAYMFTGCSSLQSINLSTLYVNTVTSMRAMFQECTSLRSVQLPRSTVSLTNMSTMFLGCSSLESITFPAGFNTSNVTTMDGLFYNCTALESITFGQLFSTAAVTDMANMFGNCSSLPSIDVSGFNTANVTNMSAMFQGCAALRTIDLSSFNTSKVTTMRWMFTLCTGLTSLSINHFDVSKVTDFRHTFNQCASLTSLNLSNWITSSITDTDAMFRQCTSLVSLNISSFNTSAVTSMMSMFDTCSSLLSLNLSNFNTALVTNMSFMFSQCEALASLDVSNFNTSVVTDMRAMFQNCFALTSLNLSSFNTPLVTDIAYMFSNDSALTQIILSSNFDTSNVTTMRTCFQGCRNLATIDLSNFDTSNVTDMGFMFSSTRSAMNNFDISGFDTSNVTDMGSLFSGTDVTNIDLSTLNTSSATNMSSMFANCFGTVSNLDLSYLDTSNAVYLTAMFAGTPFTTLDLSTFDTSNAESMERMFLDCKNLVSVDLSSFITTSVTNMRYMFSRCFALTTVDLSNFDFNGTDVTCFFDMRPTDDTPVSNVLSGILEINGNPTGYASMFSATTGDIILKGTCPILQALANTGNYHNVWVYALSANVSGGRDDYATSSIFLEVNIQRFRALNESVNVQMYLDTDAAPLTTVEWYDSEDIQREHPLTHLIMDEPAKMFIAVIPYIDENTSHVLHIYTNDAFGEATARRISIPTVYYTIDFLRGGKEISFGAKAEANDLFSILDTPAAPPFTYEYYLTEDTTVNPAKIYYRYTAGDYEVVEPIGTENPTIEGWYELQTTEFFQEYIRKNILTYIRLESKPADWSTAWNRYYTRKHESLFKVAMTTEFEDKTTATLEDILRDSAISPVVDYVVEQGISDIWTYRKWNSGIAECWGMVNTTFTSASVFGQTKYMSVGPQTLPAGLFVTNPLITATARKTQDASGMPFVSLHSPHSTTSFYYYVDDVGGSSTTYTYSCSISFEVKGRWK